MTVCDAKGWAPSVQSKILGIKWPSVLVNVYRAIHDEEKLAAYAKLAGPAVQANGGKFLIRGMPAKAYEAGMMQRTVSSSSNRWTLQLPVMTALHIGKRWQPWVMV